MTEHNFYSTLNKDAVFSDESGNFVSPFMPKKGETVTIKIRTYKDDADKIYLISKNDEAVMEKTISKDSFDYYFVSIVNFESEFDYYFRLERNGESFFYSKTGVTQSKDKILCFRILRDFFIPSWAQKCVIYQIYVDRFKNSDKTNDVRSGEYIYLGHMSVFKKDWFELPSQDDVRNFYGGDIQGVLDKLDYLKSLGIDAVYFNPLFVSPSNHKYDVQDYEHIDPHVGKAVDTSGRLLNKNEHTNENAGLYINMTTNPENLKASDEFFAFFIKTAHSMGIKVILDGVFNHCGSFCKWLDREKIYASSGKYPCGAYWSNESPYKDFFSWGNTNGWPANNSYECWWNFLNHPKLNYESSEKLFDTIMDIGCKWLSEPYNADGWRIDVGADLGKTPEFNHRFWKYFHRRIKKANPEAIIVAEHYGDASKWLLGDEWDTVMNYDAFMDPVSFFFTGMEKHSDSFDGGLYNNGSAFKKTIMENMSHLPYQSFMCSMNQLSNHDHSRFLTRTNMTKGRLAGCGSESASEGIDKAVFCEAVLFQMTWPGIPAIYYGDEAGLCGWTDPDNRRTYPWGKEDTELIDFHKRAIELRKAHKALTEGSLMLLDCGNGYISYGRFCESEKIAVAFNNLKDQSIKITIPVWKLEIPDGAEIEVLFSTEKTDEKKNLPVKDGKLVLEISQRSGMVIGYRKKI